MATNNSISMDKLIPIDSAVINPAAKYMRMIGLFLTDSIQIPTSQRVLNFTSAKNVGNFFGYESKEYYAASLYFKKYNGSTTTAPSINFARYIKNTTFSQIVGGSVLLKLSALKQITGSTFDIILNGDTYSSGIVDLSTATSFSNVGEKIVSALKANNTELSTFDITMNFDSNRNNYILSINTISTAYIFEDCPETALSTGLSMTKKTGAYLSNSVAAQTPAKNMDEIVSTTKNWISFTKLITLTEEEELALCDWVNTKSTNYTYMLFTQDQTVLDINNNDNIVGLVKDYGYKNIVMLWGDVDLATFTMSVGAQINYTAKAGAITFAYKSMAGLTYTANTDEEYDVLMSKGVNFYGKFSTKSDEFLFFQYGVITGDFKYIDNFYNQVWLNDALQNKLAVQFGSAKKIGNGDIGYNQIRSTVNIVMGYALDNKVCETEVLITDDEATEIENILGFDISGDLYNNGYYLYIGTPTQENKSERVAPDSLLFYTNNGAIQKLPIKTYFVL